VLSRLPRFHECYFTRIEGRAGFDDLPTGVFDTKCQVEAFGHTVENPSSILELDLPIGVRVLLTVLRKLYLQHGTGRRENALFRGLDQGARQYVNPILDVLSKYGLATRTRSHDQTHWLPVRKEAMRVNRIIAAPNTPGDAALEECRALC
jgi:hypothetical protein